MLSNENKTAPTEQDIAGAYRDAAVAARKLGTQLVSYERKEDPGRYKRWELENPSAGVPIRVVRPQPRILPVTDDVKQHNEYVSSLGRTGKPCR